MSAETIGIFLGGVLVGFPLGIVYIICRSKSEYPYQDEIDDEKSWDRAFRNLEVEEATLDE